MDATIRITHDPELAAAIAREVAKFIEAASPDAQPLSNGRDRLLGLAEMHRKLDVSKAAFFRIRKNPAFALPEPIYITSEPKWRESEVDAWIASRPRSFAAFDELKRHC